MHRCCVWEDKENQYNNQIAFWLETLIFLNSISWQTIFSSMADFLLTKPTADCSHEDSYDKK